LAAIAHFLNRHTRYLIADEMTAMLEANTQALIWHVLGHSRLAQHAETEAACNKLNLVAHLVGRQSNCHLIVVSIPSRRMLLGEAVTHHSTGI